MPNKKSKKKSSPRSPFPSMRARFDEAVRKSSSVQEMLEHVTAEVLNIVADERLVNALPVSSRQRLAKDLAEIAIDMHFQDMPKPRVPVKRAAEALDAANVFQAGLERLRELARSMPNDARATVTKAALAGALQMMGAQVSVATDSR